MRPLSGKANPSWDAKGSRALGLSMRRPTAVLTLAVVVLFALPLTLAEAPQNDAGLGIDAGNTRSTATLLPAEGSYSGELRSQDDDWYTRVYAPAARCAILTVAADSDSAATLAVRSNGVDHWVKAPLPQGTTSRFVLAGSAVTQAWAGLERNPNPAGNDPARPRFYSFGLETTTSNGPGDAGTGQDAGGLLSQALPITRSCVSGQVDRNAVGLGDVTDLYTFRGTQGQQLIATLGAAAPVTLSIATPTGVELGTLSPDGLLDVRLPETGEYRLTMTAASGGPVPYVIGLLGPDEPPGSGCRPTCIAG